MAEVVVVEEEEEEEETDKQSHQGERDLVSPWNDQTVRRS